MASASWPDGGASAFEYLARGVRRSPTAERVAALDLAGIGVDRDERREVPGDDLAANLIGFTGQDLTGLEGLEARYDELLRGVRRQARVRGRRRATWRRADPRRLQPDDAGPAGQLAAAHHRPRPAVRGAADPERADGGRRGRGRRRASCSTCAPARCWPRPATRPTTRRSRAESEPTDREDAATSFVVDPGSVHKAIVFGAACRRA